MTSDWIPEKQKAAFVVGRDGDLGFPQHMQMPVITKSVTVSSEM